MLCVTHELGFVRSVAHRVVFTDQGEMVEQALPEEFFANPRNERTRIFLRQILSYMSRLTTFHTVWGVHSRVSPG